MAAHVHALRIAAVERLTDDAVAVTFDVPDDLRETFRFRPGQHLALMRRDGGDGSRRSYSICSPIDGPLRVAIKRLPGGAFSTWVHDDLRAGDELDVLPPAGRFTIPSDRGSRRHYAAIAAGSGITPIISILASALATEAESRCTLIYGNRSTASIMFLEDLEDLKNRYAERLQLIHVLSREPRGLPLTDGRIDGAKLERLMDTLLPTETVDEWFLCGPLALVDEARTALGRRGVPGSSVHREVFHADTTRAPATAVRPRGAAGADAAVTIILDGRRTTFPVARDGRAIIEAALAARPDAPYACKGGVCGTCRCRLTDGEVFMDHAYALEDSERDAGVVLACQAHPLTDDVTLDFDAV